MPDKSIREMSDFERLHYSLAARTFRSVILGAIILGLASLFIGLGAYAYAVSNQYLKTAGSTAMGASTLIGNDELFKEFAHEVMDIYESLNDDQRALVGTSTYRGFFPDFRGSRSKYAEMVAGYEELLRDFSISEEVDDVYIGLLDPKTNTIVYLIDPPIPGSPSLMPGDWEESDAEIVSRFANWDGKEIITDVYDYGGEVGWVGTAGYPMAIDDSRFICTVFADTSLNTVGAALGRYALIYGVTLFVVVNLTAVLFARHMRKKLADPINAIAAAAEGYVADKRAGVAGGDHFASLNIDTGDEIEGLALTMADMERDLAEYEDSLTAATAEKERISTELNLATEIQGAMLPHIFPAYPERSEFDIYASMDPAKEVGGDFYDFFMVDENHLAMVMADVSGKGVPAALFMMAAKILINDRTLMGGTPGEILHFVNERIFADNPAGLFVTVWLGILDVRTGKVIAANAGHEFPALRIGDEGFDLYKDKHGFVVGGLEDMFYSDYELQLAPGDTLFVYTDGVAEATDANNELFGTERMIEALNAAGRDPEHILETVRAKVDEFVGDAEQFDDLTMMCVRYNGYEGQNADANDMHEEEAAMNELTIEATVENIEKVTAFVESHLEALDCPLKAQTQIAIAIDELFGNIAHYAYKPVTGPATVRVEVEESPLSVVITFIDNGKPYDPLAADDPDVTLSAEEREIGGLGVFLVKKTMDDITYEYKDGQNILKIKKALES